MTYNIVASNLVTGLSSVPTITIGLAFTSTPNAKESMKLLNRCQECNSKLLFWPYQCSVAQGGPATLTVVPRGLNELGVLKYLWVS